MNLTAMFFQTLRFYIFERCFVVDIIKAMPQKAKEPDKNPCNKSGIRTTFQRLCLIFRFVVFKSLRILIV